MKHNLLETTLKLTMIKITTDDKVTEEYKEFNYLVYYLL